MDELTETELFFVLATQHGCQVHDDSLDCDGPVQAAHVISKQTLKRHGHGDKVWDPRNAIGACYKAHRRSDAGLERFPRRVFGPEVFEFAEEVGLSWMLDKLYPRRIDEGWPHGVDWPHDHNWVSPPGLDEGAD